MDKAEDTMLRALRILGNIVLGLAVGVLTGIGYGLWRIFG